MVNISGLTFIHNLLSITGNFTIQPFIENNIICLYNGEIYNYGDYKSDGECLIPLYKKHGFDFYVLKDYLNATTKERKKCN